MNPRSHKNLKPIRFEGQMLPDWAQLLDLAAKLSRVPEDTRMWFSRFTNSSGVADARTVTDQSALLRAAIQEYRELIPVELRHSHNDVQPLQILGGWLYALDTMIEEARLKATCSWTLAGPAAVQPEESDGGDITLRRV
jgi:hypothetical protein